MRVGDIRIMFDCGCNEKFERALLDVVKDQAQNVDVILISHSTSMHVGALPFLFAHGVDIRVIATSPVTKIGAQAMHELFIQRKECPSETQ